jgi:hypothetical protein
MRASNAKGRPMLFQAVHRRAVAALAALCVLGGCIDAETLRQARLEAQEQHRLTEIDLGAYSIALPHKPGEPDRGVVDFHAFGQVTRSEHDELAATLAERAPELRAKMLLAVRSLPPQHFEDPDLAALRAGIAKVVNEVAEEQLVEHVGFYRYAPTFHSAASVCVGQTEGLRPGLLTR